MALNKYYVFLRVAERKNISRVAEELNYTQSAISHSIHLLEEEYGVPLFRRTREGVILTRYGEDLMPFIKQIVKDEERLSQVVGEMRDMHIGTLSIGAFTSVSMHIMPSVSKVIATQYPNVKLIQTHKAYDGVREDLEDGLIDVGFLSEKSKDGFDFIPILEDEYLVLLPPDHKYAHYECIPLEALEDERFVLMNEGGNFDAQKIVRCIKNAKVIHYVNEDSLAIPLVEHGIGVSILPKLVVDCFKTTAAVKRFAVPRKRTIGLAAKSFDNAPPLVKLFVKLVKEYVDTWDQGSPEE